MGRDRFCMGFGSEVKNVFSSLQFKKLFRLCTIILKFFFILILPLQTLQYHFGSEAFLILILPMHYRFLIKLYFQVVRSHLIIDSFEGYKYSCESR